MAATETGLVGMMSESAGRRFSSESLRRRCRCRYGLGRWSVIRGGGERLRWEGDWSSPSAQPASTVTTGLAASHTRLDWDLDWDGLDWSQVSYRVARPARVLIQPVSSRPRAAPLCAYAYQSMSRQPKAHQFGVHVTWPCCNYCKKDAAARHPLGVLGVLGAGLGSEGC